MNAETKEKISQLQNLEQNINSLLAQKQQFQSQQMEIDNALSQMTNSDNIYRIIGSVMVSSKKEDVDRELKEKKEIVALRLKSIDKQEQKLKEKAKELQKEVMQVLKE